jgi:glycine/sarcosine N-methyltransferase
VELNLIPKKRTKRTNRENSFSYLVMLANETFNTQYTSEVAKKWDSLVGWERREREEKPFFKRLISDPTNTKCLDLAAGTGFHSVLLRSLGCSVVAVDGSLEMLEIAKKNAIKYENSIDFIHSDWCHLNEKIKTRFDFVFCLGNSFTHIFDKASRRKIASIFSSLLVPGGFLVIDQRNYDYIVKNNVLPKSSASYFGNVKVELVSVSSTNCLFKYKYPDASAFYLKMYPISRSELINTFTSCSLRHVLECEDKNYTINPYEDSAFITHVFRKV